ncbi:MAG: ATP-binding protein, partial [Saprospiraceae bacterium]|nr:ATP-binding protein [Saprospiraceae bacterium]
VLSNLISNAIKFTTGGGDIYLQVRQYARSEEKPYCEIRVSDTGVGIEPKQLALIFNRFHQVDSSHTRTSEGTGIGLTLTKEMVELMDGEIAVESKVGKGTEFTICLPITNQAPKGRIPSLEIRSFITDYDAGQLDDMISASFHDGDLFKILIVEDNPDVAIYITSLLEARYDLAVVVNGREGINAAITMIPDLIISDIMMPQVDGFELVSVLKQDERTSHIPIILLTAKADMGSRLAGLEYGADAYLVKPFEKRELEVRIKKLIELRSHLQVYYKSVIEGAPIGSGYTKREYRFLLKIKRVIERNVQNEDFGIQDLCQAIRISRAQLHRKVKALTGKSTSRFIRSIRLREAKKLLESTDMNVSEVGYATGFTDRSHFSQVFKEEFGKSPRHFRI